jgi:hypothetical protein
MLEGNISEFHRLCGVTGQRKTNQTRTRLGRYFDGAVFLSGTGATLTPLLFPASTAIVTEPIALENRSSTKILTATVSGSIGKSR